jgi:hypothetical protein
MTTNPKLNLYTGDITVTEISQSSGTNLTPQPTATDAEVTPSADLLTAAPLVEALQNALQEALDDADNRPLSNCLAAKSKTKSEQYERRQGFKGGLITAQLKLKQALADAATIAEHSAAIWRVVALAIRGVTYDEYELHLSHGSTDFTDPCLCERCELYRSVDALPPSVRDIAGRGGR